jgi:hypothetical protein
LSRRVKFRRGCFAAAVPAFAGDTGFGRFHFFFGVLSLKSGRDGRRIGQFYNQGLTFFPPPINPVVSMAAASFSVISSISLTNISHFPFYRDSIFLSITQQYDASIGFAQTVSPVGNTHLALCTRRICSGVLARRFPRTT